MDECNVSTKLHCSQECENTVPGYLCQCKEGYELLPDGHHCRAIDKQPMRLLYANRIDIRWLVPPDQFSSYNLYIEEYRKQRTSSTTTPVPSSSASGSRQSSKNSLLLPQLTYQQQQQISEMWLQPLLQFNFTAEAMLQAQQPQLPNSPTAQPTVSSQILLNNLQNAVSIDFHWVTG